MAFFWAHFLAIHTAGSKAFILKWTSTLEFQPRLQGRVEALGTRGAFHSTKISGNFGSKSNGTEIFRKLVSKISVHLSRLSSFLEIWKFRKFPVPFGISTRYESAPVPFVVKLNYKMAASLSSWHYTRCKMICHSSSLCLIETKTLGSDFLENCGPAVPNFLWVRSPGLHTLPREKFVRGA